MIAPLLVALPDPTTVPGGSGSQTISYVVTVLIALVSGTGGWGALQFIFNRTGRKAEAARLMAQTEQSKLETQEGEARRQSMLADLQARAQQIAIESAANAYERVTRECDECRKEVREMRRSTESLINLVEEVIPHLSSLEGIPDDYPVRLRLAIRIARDSL